MTAVLVAGVTALAPTGIAHAFDGLTASPSLLQSNWYWHQVTADAPVAGAPAAPEPSNVPAGDLPVASRDGKGSPSKLSLVAFQLPAMTPGTTVSAFTLTLTIDSSANNLTPDATKLVAELALRNWANGKGGEQDVVNAPPLEATTAVPGKPSADGKTVSFTIPAIAQSWIDDANFGVGIVPAKDYTTPFQVSFLGGKDIKADMTYLPSTVVGATTTDTSGGTPAQGSTDVGTGTSPSLSLGGTPPLGAFDGSHSVSAAVPPALTAPQNAPAVTAPQAAPGAASRQALVSLSSRPSRGLMWVGAAMLTLLALISIVLGGEPEAVVTRRRSRLSSVLTARAARPVPVPRGTTALA